MGEFKTDYVLKVYREGYIFRFATRTGILGLGVLLCHAVTAVLGSLWQLWGLKSGKGVIIGWMNISEYAMLGAASAKLVEAYPNTGVGIDGGKALRSVVVLQRRVEGPLRLELVAKDLADGRTRPLVDKDRVEKYE